MAKPRKRPCIPPRRSDNNKRRLLQCPDPDQIAKLRQNIKYRGSSKHKYNPHSFDLPPFRGSRGDATLCDRHANFQKTDISSITEMIQRGLQAGLVGENGIIWAVSDNGWIYEARITNVDQTEYHGYPVRSTEPIAEMVYKRFREWAQNSDNQIVQQAVQLCKDRYGFR